MSTWGSGLDVLSNSDILTLHKFYKKVLKLSTILVDLGNGFVNIGYPEHYRTLFL